MSHVRYGLAALLLTAAVGLATVAQARDVKRCGITIGPGKTGKLVQDVQCGQRCTVDPSVRCTFEDGDFYCPIAGSFCTPERIVLERGATLDLNGFDLTWPDNREGVFCTPGRSKCTIKGPGTFFAVKSRAVTPNDRDVVLQDLTIDHDYRGFETKGFVTLSNVLLQSCAAHIRAERGAKIEASVLQSGCTLSSDKNLSLEHVEVGDGVGANGTVRGKFVTVRGGAIAGKDVYLSRSVLPEPLDTYEMSVRASGRLVLRDSAAGAIESGREPRLIRSSCLESHKPGGAGTWGVCAND